MTPAARLSAAIEVLDDWLAGSPVERALTTWARRHRFAGSSDRASIRDRVYDAVRRKRSQAHAGGGLTGRGLVLGGLRLAGETVGDLFTGIGHAPRPLDEGEAAVPGPMGALVRLDCPDWLGPQLSADLGQDFAPVMEALRQRAPVHLRVNRLKGSVDRALASLARDGIVARALALAPDALQVTANERRIRACEAYATGLVELQDAASQALVEALPLRDGQRVLDFCAGGGGKALALAARARVEIFAHDADPRRMADLPARAARAGARMTRLDGREVEARGPYDLVLADVPCSGSGTWRRAPEAKWTLTPARLAELCTIQAAILDRAARLVAPDGTLAYATCSMLRTEDEGAVEAFLGRTPRFRLIHTRRWSPLDGGDGFYLATMAAPEPGRD